MKQNEINDKRELKTKREQSEFNKKSQKIQKEMSLGNARRNFEN